VQAPGDAVLARSGDDHLAGFTVHFGVDDHTLERGAQVPVVARQVLIVPHQFARIGVESQGGVGADLVAAAGAAYDIRVRKRNRGAEEGHVQFRIVRTGGPDGTTPAVFRRNAVPACIHVGVVGISQRVETPEFLTVGGIVSGDVASAGGAHDGAARSAG